MPIMWQRRLKPLKQNHEPGEWSRSCLRRSQHIFCSGIQLGSIWLHMDACFSQVVSRCWPCKVKPPRRTQSLYMQPVGRHWKCCCLVGHKYHRLSWKKEANYCFQHHSLQYPTLVCMAWDYLAIQGSAVPSECALECIFKAVIISLADYERFNNYSRTLWEY